MTVSNLWQYVAVTAGMLAVWLVASVAYNVLLHPLRKFPGPLLHRASSLPWVIDNVLGKQAFHTQKLHDEYGSVVRISPNHLSFTDPQAWKDIYGHRVGSEGKMDEMGKARIFTRTIDNLPTSIINSDREEHSRLRRALSHGFSSASMRQQEPLIAHHVNLLMRRLGERCSGGNATLNMEAWYNFTTFDIVGALVFGKSFQCLEKGEYNPYVLFLIQTVQFGAVLVGLSYLGLRALVQAISRNGGSEVLMKTRRIADELIRYRLESEKQRNDLFEGLVSRRDEWNLSFEKLSANANILIIAGSETTATTLSGVTYLLLTHPEVLSKLKQEVRMSFNSPDEMTISSVSALSYMLAVLNEALRLYPPVAANLVRSVPVGGACIAGHYVTGGALVEVQPWSANHSTDNWTNPWKFNPDRFLDDAETASKRGNKLEALQAFSLGPRNCIGRNLAYAEMRLILARIIYHFDMHLADDGERWIEKQKAYGIWHRIPLNVYLTPVVLVQ